MGNSKLCFNWDSGVRHVAGADPHLARVIKAAGNARLEIRPARSPFEYLLRAIIYQQLAGRAAQTIHGRLLDLFPRRRPQPDALLKLKPEKLRAAGVSANKQKAIKDLARHAGNGGVPGFAAMRRLDDEEIIAQLTAIHGVGRWTVEMLLIFQLGRPDVLPVADLGVRKGFARAHGMSDAPDARMLAELAARWQPYRSVGSWYCWRALELRQPT
jgi:DNA-3-methyladenine glycosylase II